MTLQFSKTWLANPIWSLLELNIDIMKYWNIQLIKSFNAILTHSISFTQGVQWANNFGGTFYDERVGSYQNMDGRYVLLWSSWTGHENFTQNNGGRLMGIIRFDEKEIFCWLKITAVQVISLIGVNCICRIPVLYCSSDFFF